MSYSLSHQRLPWSQDVGEARILRAAIVFTFAFLIVSSWFINNYQLPEVDRKKAEELPPQLARLIKEQKKKPIPVVPKKPQQVKPEIKKPNPVPVPVPEQKPKASIKKERKLEETKKASAEQIKQARDVASKSGILAMQTEMQALSNVVSSSGFSSDGSSVTRAANAKKIDNASATQLGELSTSKASDSQEVVVASREIASVEGAQLDATQAEKALAQAEQNRKSGRNEDEFQIVVEGLRSTYNLLYNRALRNDPFLEGKLVLEVTIESNGSVVDVKTIENTLSDDALVAKLIARMQLTNFGASPGPKVVRILPFEFTPS